MIKDWSDFVRESIGKRSEIIFTKKEINFLERRNKCTLQEMKEELCSLQHLTFAHKQTSTYQGKTEERFRCYFVYSGTRGRCYVLRFNHQIKAITVFPLGRRTLRKYKKRFK